MAELKIGDGLVTYNLNGKCEITYNPTDLYLLEQIYTVFEELDKKQEEYQKIREQAQTPREIFEYAREQDGEMRKIIHNLFGIDVCTPLFGTVNVYATDGDGLPLWASLLLTVFDTMEISVSEEQKKRSTRIDKYLKKYHR